MLVDVGPGRSYRLAPPLDRRRRQWQCARAIAVAAVLVIGTRERMHGFVHLIPQDEVLTAEKFLILVGVVLRLAPDTRLIAISPVTPRHIGLAVVAISGLSYLTYLVQRTVQ
jgi:uncharacterized membrane protein (DUF4010 family)